MGIYLTALSTTPQQSVKWPGLSSGNQEESSIAYLKKKNNVELKLFSLILPKAPLGKKRRKSSSYLCDAAKALLVQ